MFACRYTSHLFTVTLVLIEFSVSSATKIKFQLENSSCTRGFFCVWLRVKVVSHAGSVARSSQGHIDRQTTIHPHSHTFGPFRIPNPSHMHVFGMWHKHTGRHSTSAGHSCGNGTRNLLAVTMLCVVLKRIQRFITPERTNLLFMQYHLALQGAPQRGHCDKGLPDPTDGPGEDVVKLHAVDAVPSLLHGVQGHRVTRGHVDGICKSNTTPSHECAAVRRPESK